MMKQSFKQTVVLIKSDMQFRCDYEKKPLTFIQAFKFLLSPAAMATVIYRIQQFFYCNHLGLIGAVFKMFNSVIFTVDIDRDTEIAPGLLILHAVLIVIGPNVKIGERCMLGHHNGVVPSPFCKAGASQTIAGPCLGDDVIVGGGAVVSGDVTLGDGVQVSMGSTVIESFPRGSVLLGVPAKCISNTEKGEAK